MVAGSIDKKKVTERILFLINILLPFHITFFHSRFNWILIALQGVLIVYLFVSNFHLFCHAFFWVLLSIFFQLHINWLLGIIGPLLLYFIVVALFKKIRSELDWLKIGTIDPITLILMIAFIGITSVALIGWVLLFQPNLYELTNMVPVKSIGGLIVLGLLFALVNSTWEECMFRGILWNGFESIWQNGIFILITQAVLFGLIHVKGFPNGIVGICMAVFYGLCIGIIRCISKGMLAPIITHIFADLTIFTILILSKMGIV